MKSNSEFSCFFGKNNAKKNLLSIVASIREKKKFTNQTSQRQGFDAFSWLIKTQDSDKLLQFSSNLGIPPDVAHAYQYFYEHQLCNRIQHVPEQFISSLVVGSDLSQFWRKYFHRILTNSPYAPLKHRVENKFLEMFEALAELYGSNATAQDERWTHLETHARTIGQNSTVWFNDTLLTYEFCAAWMVARSCAYYTRPSSWWAPAMLGRFLCLDGAYKIEILKLPKENFEDNQEIVDLYDIFTFMLSSEHGH